MTDFPSLFASLLPGFVPKDIQTPARCPFHEDRTPSLSVNTERWLWRCHSCGKAGNAAQLLALVKGIGAAEAHQEVFGPGRMPSIPLEDVEAWHAALMDGPKLAYLTSVRGWSVDVIRQLKIGHHAGRYMIPAFDHGDCRNAYRYLPGAKHRKMMPFADGYPVDLWPLANLIPETVYICEGQPDAILAMGLGLPAITMGGATSWKDDYSKRFDGKHVVLLLDMDEQGRIGAEKIARSLQGHAATIRDVRLPGLPTVIEDQKQKDLTDWIVRIGNTADTLTQLIAATPEWKPAATPEPSKTPLVDAILKMWMPISVNHTKMIAWSKKNKRIEELEVSNFSNLRFQVGSNVGNVTDWVRGIIANDEDEMSVREALLGSFETIAGKLPPSEHLKQLGDGVHLVEDSMVLVNGNKFLVAEDGAHFRRLDVPSYRGFILSGKSNWLRWDAEELNRDPVVPLADAFDIILQSIGMGWDWEMVEDAEIHALLTLVSPILSMWERKPLIHVKAPSNSGKSKLLKGWYCGTAYPAMQGPYATPCGIETDLTLAGLMSKYANSGKILCLDEQEISENANVTKVLAAVRSSMDSDSGVLRGRRDGGYREERVNMAVILASIEPITIKEADATRWIVTELQHHDNREDPEKKVMKFIQDANTTPADLKLSLFVGAIRAAQAIAEKSRNLPPASDYALETRTYDAMRPLLAAHAYIGKDWASLSKRLAEAKEVQSVAVKEYATPERLLQTIMGAPFLRENEMGAKATTTLGVELDKGNAAQFPEVGCFIAKMDDGGLGLYLNWSNLKGTLLRTSEWNRRNEQALASLARESPFYAGTIRMHIWGKLTRFTAFRLPPKGEQAPEA